MLNSTAHESKHNRMTMRGRRVTVTQIVSQPQLAARGIATEDFDACELVVKENKQHLSKTTFTSKVGEHFTTFTSKVGEHPTRDMRATARHGRLRGYWSQIRKWRKMWGRLRGMAWCLVVCLGARGFLRACRGRGLG